MRPRVNARNRPEPLEDEELQQLITERIEEDPVFWTGSGRRRTYVTVEVEDGHVMLSGCRALAARPAPRRHPGPGARAPPRSTTASGVAEDVGRQGKGEAERGVTEERRRQETGGRTDLAPVLPAS